MPAPASAPVQALLDEAETLRSADPERFRQLLDDIESELPAATPRQRDQYHYLRAYEQAFDGRFDLAIDSAKQLFERGSDANMRFRAGSFLVNNFAATREFTEGLRYLNLTMPLLGEVSDREIRHHGLLSAALLYNQLDEEELGLGYAEDILADAPTPRVLCYAAHLRIESLLALDRLPPGTAAFEQVIDDCASIDELVGANFVRMHLARHLHREGHTRQALQLLERYLAEVEATRYARLIGEFHSLLAELQLASGEAERAQVHASRALDYSAGIESTLPLVVAYRVLYEVALLRGDDSEALRQFRRYAEADRAYLDDVKARETAVQLVRHETLQKERTIEALNSQNRVLQLEQELARNDARNKQLLLALLTALLASIGYWAWKTKRMQMSFRRLAETDALTGISNRHHFSARAAERLAQCARDGQPATLVMFDLDEFKAINDRFGHAVGDWVLVQVADALRDAGRRGDLFGRLGGEEFAFLLPAADAETGRRLGEDCRRRLAAIDSGPSGHVFRISASFGVADSGSAGHDFQRLLASADAAMYAAKRGGRDRVLVFAPEA